MLKHNKLYAYDDSIKNYILDDTFSNLIPRFDGKGNIEFRDTNSIKYKDVVSSADLIYFENRLLAETFFSKIKTIDDARKRSILMAMIAELNNDILSSEINDIARKIIFGQEMLKEIQRTLHLELEKLQDIDVI